MQEKSKINKKRPIATKQDLNQSILVDGELPPAARKIYEESFAASQKAIEPIIARIRRSRMISAADMQLRINCRG